jgi:hypothetical protein
MKDEDPETISDLLSFILEVVPYEFAFRVYMQRSYIRSAYSFKELNRRFATKTLSRRSTTIGELIADIKPEYRELALSLIAQCEMSML